MCHPIGELFCSGWGIKSVFSDVGVEPKQSVGCFICFVVMESVGYFEMFC